MTQVYTVPGMLHAEQCTCYLLLDQNSIAFVCQIWLLAAGTVQYVYAVRDVKKGEQLCVHYTNLHEPRRVRQETLLQARFFSCACERCSVPIEQSVDRFLEVTAQTQIATLLQFIV